MNWHAFFAVIAVASGIGAWIALMYGLNTSRNQVRMLTLLYSVTTLLVLVCATAAGLSC